MSLYCRTQNPTYELKVIVTVIVKAYILMVLDIMLPPEFWNGSIYKFNYLMRCKQCLKAEHLLSPLVIHDDVASDNLQGHSVTN